MQSPSITDVQMIPIQTIYNAVIITCSCQAKINRIATLEQLFIQFDVINVNLKTQKLLQ